MWDRGRAYRFILLMGAVSLLADFTYEGARGIVGPYLAHLGASGLVVSLLAGTSELLGYWTRLLSGYLSDRLRSYWSFTLLGYALTLLSVPALGLAKSWQVGGLLLFCERIGKGLRTPSRDALLSRATELVGHGKGFGLHEFLDQMGAVLGPLAVGLILLAGYGYRTAFFSLFLPALLALLVLWVAKTSYGEELVQGKESFTSLGKEFYWYMLASCLAFGSSLPFPLIGFYLSAYGGMEEWGVALLFALAMGVSALFALLFGLLYDRVGIRALPLGLALGLLCSPTLFLLHQPVLAVVFWGIGLGVQESVMRSAVASLSDKEVRGRAYGYFHFSLGLSALLGGLLMGLLFEFSAGALVAYSVSLQALAAVALLRLKP